jgi:hypothetical protein
MTAIQIRREERMTLLEGQPRVFDATGERQRSL